MLRTEHFYWFLGALLLYAGWCNLLQRRFAHAAFWGVLAALFGAGDAVLRATEAGNALPSQLAGCGVVALGLLATRMRREHVAEAPEAQRRASARRLGHKLFVPALLIPLLTVLVVMFGDDLAIGGSPLFGSGSLTLIGLSIAGLVSAVVALAMTRQPR